MHNRCKYGSMSLHYSKCTCVYIKDMYFTPLTPLLNWASSLEDLSPQTIVLYVWAWWEIGGNR